MASQVGRFSGKAEANKGGSGKGNGSAEEKGTGRGLAGEGHKGSGQSKGDCCGKRKTRVVVDERSDGESHVEGDYEVGESSLRPMHTVTYERALHSCCEGDYMKKPAPDAKPTIHFVRGKRSVNLDTLTQSNACLVKVGADIDAEREAKGELPVTDEEFMSVVYDPSQPSVISLQNKMKQVWASQLECQSPSIDPPPSPRTQKEILRKKDIMLTLEVRPPKKGRSILHPQDSVGELVRAWRAAVLSQAVQKSHVPDSIYMMMSRILKEVKHMVSLLPMNEVKQSLLDEEVQKLATAAFPDPSQHSLKTHYIGVATGLIDQILEDNDKVVVKEVLEKTPGKGQEVAYNDEDEYAYLYPLS